MGHLQAQPQVMSRAGAEVGNHMGHHVVHLDKGGFQRLLRLDHADPIGGHDGVEGIPGPVGIKAALPSEGRGEGLNTSGDLIFREIGAGDPGGILSSKV